MTIMVDTVQPVYILDQYNEADISRGHLGPPKNLLGWINPQLEPSQDGTASVIYEYGIRYSTIYYTIVLPARER